MNKLKDITMDNQQVSHIDLENYEELKAYPKFWIDNLGNIVSTVRTKPRLLKKRLHYGKSKNPYYRTKVGAVNALAHRVIASAHLGRVLKSDEVVNHIDGNTLNNALDNLEVITQEENVAHAVENNLYCSGEEWYLARGISK